MEQRILNRNNTQETKAACWAAFLYGVTKLENILLNNAMVFYEKNIIIITLFCYCISNITMVVYTMMY